MDTESAHLQGAEKRKNLVVVTWGRPKLTEYNFDHQEPFTQDTTTSELYFS